MGKSKQPKDVQPLDVINILHTAFVVARSNAAPGSPFLRWSISHDGDHKSSEIILTDHTGKDWVVSSSHVKELPPDEQ